ncbi:uncharacterized protein [Dysidea avara]|uniref:uncharacterized protein isoform X1 n=2 Tax=Dysidea avara TaxID=196820 RepID=UPI003330B073
MTTNCYKDEYTLIEHQTGPPQDHCMLGEQSHQMRHMTATTSHKSYPKSSSLLRHEKGHSKLPNVIRNDQTDVATSLSSGVGYCEVLIRPLVAGAVSVDLNCTITHRSLPLVMCVRASAKAPSLTSDLPPLNYGLITNGCSKTLQE